MSPRAKKTYGKRQYRNNTEVDTEEKEINKENIYSRLRKREKKNEQNLLQLRYDNTDAEDEFEKLLSSPQKQEVKLRPLTFWSKKLQDLETQKDIIKKKTYKLYEFSDTDESFSPTKKKKKPKRKYGTQKKKQIEFPPKPKKKSEKAFKEKSSEKEKHKRSLLREKVMLNKEKEKLADKEDKFTFSTVMPSLGVTSTPAINKVNIIGASSFMFMSPVIKEVDDECLNFNVKQCETPKPKTNKSHNKNVCTKNNTPKRVERINEKVLRNRKLVC